MHASEQERPDVAAARAAWIAAQPDLQTRRSPRRPSAVGHWKVLTFLAGLRRDGIIAPFVIDRAMTRAIFLEYLRQCLVPTLAPGDIVVMDNPPARCLDALGD